MHKVQSASKFKFPIQIASFEWGETAYMHVYLIACILLPQRVPYDFHGIWFGF